MKRTLALILSVIFLFALASCEVGVKDTWFSDEMLKSHGISSLPMPFDTLSNTVLAEYESDDGKFSGIFYFTATKDELNNYAKAVVEYLLKNENVFNLGELEGHGGLIGEIVPYDDYKLVDEGFKYDQSLYNLAYSLSPTLNMGGGYIPSLDNPIKITIASVEAEELYSGFTYNAKIEIKQTSWPACAIVDAEVGE